MNIMGLKFSALAAIACSLTACSTMNRTLEPTPIFGPPDAATTIAAQRTGSTCANATSLLMTTDTGIPSEIDQFSYAMYCAYTTSDDTQKGWLKRFVSKGIALSDQTCNAYFDDLESRRVESAYSQTNFNLTGTAVTAIIAATQAHQRSIVNLATLLAAGNAWFENYKANYIMTPQLSKLHDKIQTSLRDPLKGQINSKAAADGYLTFDDAKQDVYQYDALCSHKVLHDIVTDLVAKGDLAPASPTPSAEQASADALTTPLFKKASGAEKGTFANGELEALYALADYQPATDHAAAATAFADLTQGRDVAKYAVNLGLAKDPPDAASVQDLRKIGALENLNGNTTVIGFQAALSARVAALAKKDANPPPAAATPTPKGAKSHAAPAAPAAPPPPPPPSTAEIARVQGLLDHAQPLTTPALAAKPRVIQFGYQVRDHSQDSAR